MAGKKSNQADTGRSLIQLSLPGLIVFSISLIAVTAVTVHFLVPPRSTTEAHSYPTNTMSGTLSGRPEDPWGELVLRDIELERPAEYVAYEAGSNSPPTWTFPAMPLDKLRDILTAAGLSTDETGRVLSPERVGLTASNVITHPDEELVLKLSPQVRGKLYGVLSQYPENHYIKYPFIFPGKSFDTIAAEHQIEDPALPLIRSLMYQRGDNQCFSDFEVVMRKLPSEADRIKLIQALSRQSAVLAGVHIRPDTDIDKLLGYWGAVPGVHFKDIRPLLESLKRLPEGGNVSIMYLLPQFARQRLYTFPMPNQAGDPRMDCHWSTMNFFNNEPNNQFNDATYTAQYLATNYYPIAKPSAYGDLVFLLDDKNNAVHSAVYIADDLVFTKNGDNYLQPWMLMHLKDLLGTYSVGPTPRVVVYRNKNT